MPTKRKIRGVQRRHQLRKAEKRDFKLMPELIPRPLWNVSACKKLQGTAKWKAIRQDTLEAAGHRCVICGGDNPRLYCHEKWQYDTGRGVATVRGFIMVCDPCNWATHIGLANVRGHRTEAVEQLCRVNKITEKQAEALIEGAARTWERLSQQEWTVRVAPSLLKKYLQLDVLDGATGMPLLEILGIEGAGPPFIP